LPTPKEVEPDSDPTTLENIIDEAIVAARNEAQIDRGTMYQRFRPFANTRDRVNAYKEGRDKAYTARRKGGRRKKTQRSGGANPAIAPFVALIKKKLYGIKTSEEQRPQVGFARLVSEGGIPNDTFGDKIATLLFPVLDTFLSWRYQVQLMKIRYLPIMVADADDMYEGIKNFTSIQRLFAKRDPILGRILETGVIRSRRAKVVAAEQMAAQEQRDALRAKMAAIAAVPQQQPPSGELVLRTPVPATPANPEAAAALAAEASAIETRPVQPLPQQTPAIEVEGAPGAGTGLFAAPAATVVVAPVEVTETPEGCPANKAVGKHVGISEGRRVIRAGTVVSFAQLPTEMQKEVQNLKWIYGHCHIKIKWADTNTEQILDPSNVVPMSDDEFNAFVQPVATSLPLPAAPTTELLPVPQPVGTPLMEPPNIRLPNYGNEAILENADKMIKDLKASNDTIDIVESPVAAAPPIPPPRAQLAPQSKVRMVTPRVRVNPPGVPGRGSRAKTQRAARQEGVSLGIAPPLPMSLRGTSTVASTIPAPPPLPGTGLATAFETRNSAAQPQPRPAVPPEPPSFAKEAAAIKENGLALQEAQLQLARDQAATRAAKREVERQINSRRQRYALRKGGRRKTPSKRKTRKSRKSTFRRHRKH
jgi:hypothetical protein